MSSGDAGVVVVGAGIAGVTVVRQLRASGYTGSLVLLGDEQQLPYDHPPLSKELLAGLADEGDVQLFRAGEIAELDVQLRLGIRAGALRAADRALHLDDGTTCRYTECVLATGSRVRTLPGLPKLAGLLTLRTLPDAVRLRDALAAAHRVVVVGGGFIGLEVAAVAAQRGARVTVVEQEPLPLRRVLGEHGGVVIRDLHGAHGVDVRCGVSVAGILAGSGAAAGRVAAVRLDDGTELLTDLVVVGVGALPNVEWLSDSGLLTDNGIVCDAGGRTSLAHVWAAGDAARWPNDATGLHQRVEQWQSAVEQASILARNLADPARDERWCAVPYFWSDQFGAKIQFCGHAGAVARVLPSAGGPVVGFVSASGTLCGVLAIGQPTLIARGRRLVARAADPDELLTLVST